MTVAVMQTVPTLTLFTPLIVDPEFKTLIPPLTPEEYKELERSLLNEGCRDSIVVWNNTIIDGHNRYEICTKNNIPYNVHEMKFGERDDAKLWMIDNQLARRNIDKWERLELAKARKPLIEKKGKENQKLSEGQGIKGSPKLANLKIIDTREEMAKEVGVSHGTLDKMEEIQEKKPEIIKDIKAGKTSINKAFKDIKIQERKEEIKSTITKNPPLPNGKYNIIYADPPWKYEFAKLTRDAIESHYPTMELEDIKKMQIPVEDDAVLLLWTTAPKLEEAIEVLNSWGFSYRSCAVWDKEKLGMGYWFRVQHELLLIGVKGEFRTPEPTDRISSIIRIPRSTTHSKKPEEMYGIIEKMFPGKKYLELFSRNERKGWTSWGNQI